MQWGRCSVGANIKNSWYSIEQLAFLTILLRSNHQLPWQQSNITVCVKSWQQQRHQLSRGCKNLRAKSRDIWRTVRLVGQQLFESAKIKPVNLFLGAHDAETQKVRFWIEPSWVCHYSSGSSWASFASWVFSVKNTQMKYLHRFCFLDFLLSRFVLFLTIIFALQTKQSEKSDDSRQINI